MDAVVRPQLARIAATAGLALERLAEGTVRFSLPGTCPAVDVTADWFGLHARGSVYCVGREAAPPLANSTDKPARRRFPLLARHRVVLLSADEVPEVASTLSSAGWCVDNDAYLFPQAGGWLAYAGHNDELVVYLPRRGADEER